MEWGHAVLEPGRAAGLLLEERRPVAGARERRRAVGGMDHARPRVGDHPLARWNSCSVRARAVRPRRQRARGADAGHRRNSGRGLRRAQHRWRELVAGRHATGLLGWRSLHPSRADAGLLRHQDHLHGHRARAWAVVRRQRLWRAAGRLFGRRRRQPAVARCDRVVFDRQSPDFKRRSTFVADVATGTARLLREDVDEKFWSIPGNAGAAAQPSPDGKWIVVPQRPRWLGSLVCDGRPRVAPQCRSQKASSKPGGRRGRPMARGSLSTRTTRASPGDRHLGIATIRSRIPRG